MEFLGLRKNFEKHVLRLSPRKTVQREIHLHYISHYYRVKKQRLRKTAIWAYVRRGRVVIECSRAAEAAYYIGSSLTYVCWAVSFLTVLQRLQEPATSAWR